MSYTNVSEVFEAFLSKVSNYEILSLTDQEVEDELFPYLTSARTKFFRCKKDLNIVSDELSGELRFNALLHPFEIEILATLMVVEFINPALNSSEIIKPSLSDKEFKVYSQANHIRELRLLKRELKREASALITTYTFLDLKEEG